MKLPMLNGWRLFKKLLLSAKIWTSSASYAFRSLRKS